MKKAIFQADPNKGGFISSFIAPVNTKPVRKFSALDGLLIVGLVVGLLTMMRLLLAR